MFSKCTNAVQANKALILGFWHIHIMPLFFTSFHPHSIQFDYSVLFGYRNSDFVDEKEAKRQERCFV